MLFSFLLLLLCAVPSFAAAAKNVALLIDGDPSVKGGYNYVCAKSLEYAQKRYPQKISAKLYNSMGLSKEETARLVESALKASNLVIAASPAFTKYLDDRAPDFPSVTIISIDGDDAVKIKQTRFRNEELGFLAGSLAAIVTKSDAEKSGRSAGDTLTVG
ncbi:MAG: BMP family ABC transporter substrate-binding protein, partial [Synergistaceae bacterium]